jgi:N-hydroxyarylamine O-acetyltransferase
MRPGEPSENWATGELMQLGGYLERIGYQDVTRPDMNTLRGLQRAHVCAIPFENLDVQLGRPLTTDSGDAYDKIVERRRGGWCYEQNGLFGWALGQIGFDVMRVAAAVMRADRGDVSEANHLALLVRLPGADETWLVDVGFGGSLLEPIRLEASEHLHPPYRLGLRPLDDGSWQFWEDPGSGEFSFDFRAEPASEDALARKCEFLQTDPDSSFILNLVAQIRAPGRHTALRGRVLTHRDTAGEAVTIIGSADELVEVLAQAFGLDVPEIGDCWPRIAERHEQLLGS